MAMEGSRDDIMIGMGSLKERVILRKVTVIAEVVMGTTEFDSDVLAVLHRLRTEFC